MADKIKKPLNPRAEQIVKGLFLLLFSVVCVINVGKVARTLAFVPLYLFGGAYYVLFILLGLIGLFKIFAPKFNYKKITYFIAAILVFIGVFFVCSVTYIHFPGNMYVAVDRFHQGLEGYYTVPFINAFEEGNNYQGGLLGVLMHSTINNQTISLFVGITLFALAFLLVTFPYIVKAIKIIKSRPKKEKKVKPVKPKLEKPVKVKEIKKPVEQVAEEPVANEKEPLEVKPGFESDQKPFINENSGFSKPTVSLDDSYGVKYNQTEYNEFTPLVFSKQRKATPVSESTSTPVVETKPVVNEQPEEEEEVNLIETRPNEITHNDSPEERPALDESLVRAQPVFLSPEDESVAVEEVKETKVAEAPKKKERVVWIPPSTELLATYDTTEAQELNEKVAASRLEAINRILTDFKVGARCTGYKIGPGITRYNIEYDANVTVKSVERLVGDISMRLGGVSTRFTPIVPNETFSGLEVPNAAITTVSFKEIVESLPDVKKHPLSVAFGKDISGNVIAADFNEFPHLLVAGTTGSGKSIYIHSIISTLIMRVSPDDLKIVLVDPKKVEMTKYRDMPHLLTPIITEASKAKVLLSKLVDEMNDRYERFANSGSSNIEQFNELAEENNEERMPYIIVVLDEYADLVDTCKDISQPVVSIAQKARAAGIHLCISTQRPSTNVITGVIKGNLPTHVALTTSNYTDSMTIIGEGGAETLQGKGDMLVQSPLVSRVGVTRLQGCYVQNKEIIHIVSYLKEHYQTYYDDKFLDLVDHSKETAREMIASGEVQKEADEAEEMKYQSVKEWVLTQKFVSMSKIQRECQVGFNRAGKFFKRLQMEGVVDFEVDGVSKGCRVLVTNDDDNSDDSNIVTSGEVIF